MARRRVRPFDIRALRRGFWPIEELCNNHGFANWEQMGGQKK